VTGFVALGYLACARWFGDQCRVSKFGFFPRLSGFLQIDGNISFAADDFLALLFDISLISLKQR
jgi:hypothetical protein